METMLDTNYRVSGGIVNLNVAGVAAGCQVIYIVSAFAAQIGTKSFVPKKLRVRNNAAGNCWLFLGTGIGAVLFAARYPAFYLLNNIDSIWQEVELPRVEFFASMTAYVDVLAAGSSCDVMVEIGENG